MPKNSTGTIQVNRDLDCSKLPAPKNGGAAAFFEFSPQDTTVRLTKIPTVVAPDAGVIGVLPPFPDDGDTYEVVDLDGSLSSTSGLVILADSSQTPTPTFSGSSIVPLNPLPAYVAFEPFAGASFTYDQASNQWIITNKALQIGGFEGTNTAGGAMSAANITGGTPTILLAAEMVPTGARLIRLIVAMSFALSATDDVSAVIETIANVTSFTGGTGFNGIPGAGITARVETAADGAIVIVGDAPATFQTIERHVDTADIGHVDLSFTVDLFLPGITAPAGTKQSAVAVTLGTAAANITGITVSSTVQVLE